MMNQDESMKNWIKLKFVCRFDGPEEMDIQSSSKWHQELKHISDVNEVF